MAAERAQQEARLRQSFIDFVAGSIAERLEANLDVVGALRSYREKSIITNLGTLPLHDFARNQQMKNIKKYLSAHKNEVDCTDPDSGVTPLMTACSYGHLKVVKLLLGRGANVNFKCSGLNGHGLKYSNVTPVYIAAEEGHEEIVRYLVENGADLNVKCSPLGFTPLHRAVHCRHDDMVFTLVDDLDATVNIPNSDGQDPILTAVKCRAHEILDTLVAAKGADSSIPETTEKVTPLHYAAYYGDLKSVEALHAIGKANLNAELVGGFTPLDLAIQQKHKKVSDFLRNVGAQRNVRNSQWQPYVDCVAGGLLPLKAAINKGVNVNATVVRGGTALHYNVSKLNWEACKFLLRKGANVNHQDHFGDTPLHKAANIGRTDYLKLLLDNGADVKAVNGAGSTPLHATAKKGHYSAAKILIDNGADLEAVEHEGGSPIFSAAVKGHSNVLKLLLSHGVDPNSKARIDTIDNVSVLVISCMHSGHKPDVIKALVNAGADVNARIKTEQGELSTLHLLPVENDKYDESLKILIEAGAFIDAEVKTYETVALGNSSKKMK
uniref:Uncharacterized protein n=2 Tax=Lygus hesperus TaxID=30085 RepID=A0A0A9XYD6_LYGHE